MPPLLVSVTASIPGKVTTTLLWHTTAVSATVHLRQRLVLGVCHILLMISTRQLTALGGRTIVAVRVPGGLLHCTTARDIHHPMLPEATSMVDDKTISQADSTLVQFGIFDWIDRNQLQ